MEVYLKSILSLGYLLELVILVLAILINVAFITLLERKILGYSQLRLGPTKPSFAGILQPIRDAIKLFTKNYFSGLNAIKSTFYLRPFLRIFLVLII